jgi:hypothetical protein
MKEELSVKEVEECKFAPFLMTKKKGETPAHRDLNKFLEDQKRYDDMKKQKMIERSENFSQSQASQYLRGPYMN